MPPSQAPTGGCLSPEGRPGGQARREQGHGWLVNSGWGSRRVRACVLSNFGWVWISVPLWTMARQTPLSMGFSRQGYWSGLPCPSPGDLPDPGIEPVHVSCVFCIAGGFFTHRATGEQERKSQELCVLDVLLMDSLYAFTKLSAKYRFVASQPCKLWGLSYRPTHLTEKRSWWNF